MAARLGRAARTAREKAGYTLMEIAVHADVSQTTIHRFEYGDGWRRETDAIVAAYAELCGITEEALWRAALRLGDP